MTYEPKTRTQRCLQRIIKLATISITRPSLHNRAAKAAKATDAELVEEPKNKKHKLKDNSCESQLAEALRNPRECNTIQRGAFKLPRFRRYRSNWRRRQGRLNQVDIIHRLSSRFLLRWCALLRIAANRHQLKLRLSKAWRAVQ